MSNFKLSLSVTELTSYLKNQLDNFFPDKKNESFEIERIVERALNRLEFCFLRIKGKYYNNGIETRFNYLNGDQYCMFLYFLSKEAYIEDNEKFYLKFSLLNKHLFSIDLFGHIKMPDIFLLIHPLGTIIGRATFENYLVLYQGVTIGGVFSNSGTINYPSMGKGVVCYANTSVIGESQIGKNVIIGANTSIVGRKIEDNSIVVGSFPNLKISLTKKDVQDMFFIPDRS